MYEDVRYPIGIILAQGLWQKSKTLYNGHPPIMEGHMNYYSPAAIRIDRDTHRYTRLYVVYEDIKCPIGISWHKIRGVVS